jgi:hypothetical protein
VFAFFKEDFQNIYVDALRSLQAFVMVPGGINFPKIRPCVELEAAIVSDAVSEFADC